MSSVQQQRRTVEQLRREAAIKRLPVSYAIDDLKVNITAEDDVADDASCIHPFENCSQHQESYLPLFLWFPDVYNADPCFHVL